MVNPLRSVLSLCGIYRMLSMVDYAIYTTMVELRNITCALYGDAHTLWYIKQFCTSISNSPTAPWGWDCPRTCSTLSPSPSLLFRNPHYYYNHKVFEILTQSLFALHCLLLRYQPGTQAHHGYLVSQSCLLF